MRSKCRHNLIHTVISYFSPFLVQKLSGLFYVDRNFVFEIQFALAMELNFLIACGRLLDDPCSNAVWISSKLYTKSIRVCVGA